MLRTVAQSVAADYDVVVLCRDIVGGVEDTTLHVAKPSMKERANLRVVPLFVGFDLNVGKPVRYFTSYIYGPEIFAGVHRAPTLRMDITGLSRISLVAHELTALL